MNYPVIIENSPSLRSLPEKPLITITSARNEEKLLLLATQLNTNTRFQLWARNRWQPKKASRFYFIDRECVVFIRPMKQKQRQVVDKISPFLIKIFKFTFLLLFRQKHTFFSLPLSLILPHFFSPKSLEGKLHHW